MIEDRDIAPDLVRRFADHMADEYQATIKTKDGFDGAMLGAGLGLLGVDSGKYATTIGRTIYLPHPAGSPHEVWDLWGQIETITHECQHIVQHDRTGLLGHAFRYAQAAGRTMLEAEAYSTAMDLAMWRRGSIDRWWLDWRPEALRGYLVGELDVAVMRRTLLALAPTVRRGGIVTHAGRTAISWLNDNAPELRAPRTP